MSNPIDWAWNQLSQLSARRASSLFSVVLLTSFVFLLLRNRLPLRLGLWMPVILVFIYGVALYSSQRSGLFLNSTTKDSPYFLGFILTLIALVLFLLLDFESAMNEPSLLAFDLGAAIGTTAVGLAVRQTLWSRSPEEELRDAVFQSLLDEIRVGAADFRLLQSRFIGLVQEFVDTRDKLWSREEAAFTRYAERLEQGGRVLTQIAEKYPDRIGTFLSSFDNAATSIASTGRQLNENAQALSDTLKETVRQCTDQALALRALAASYPQAGTALATSLNELSREVDATRQNLSALTAELAGVVKAASSLPGELRGTLVGLGSGIEAANKEVVERIHADIQAIDRILDEFVTLVRSRLSSWASAT